MTDVPIRSFVDKPLLERSLYIFDLNTFVPGEAAKACAGSEELCLEFLNYAYSGWSYSPSIWFDAPWYGRRYDPNQNEMKNSGLALEHFLRSGWAHNMTPSPYFDCRFYIDRYQRVRDRMADGETLNAVEDYVRFGASEGLSPNPWFDEAWYRKRYKDVVPAIEAGEYPSGYMHYVVNGRSLRRDPSPKFSEGRYLGANPDVAAAVVRGEVVCGFDHWLRYGLDEGRDRGNDRVDGKVLVGAS